MPNEPPIFPDSGPTFSGVPADNQPGMAFGPSSTNSNQEPGSAEGAKPRADGAKARTDKASKRSSATNKQAEDKLIDQTKTQIRSLVQEISDLSHSDCSVDEFYEGFLTRTVTALASVGGAIWIREGAGQPIDLQYHINLKQTALNDDLEAQKKHGQLIKRLLDAGEPALVAPNSGTNDSEIGSNPTENLLVVGPLKIDGETVGLVEIFQRAGAGPTTQRGYMRFLLQMCDIGSEFLGNQKIRSFEQQQQMWHKLEKFIQAVHQNLDVDETVFAIANEGRRLIDCDRVSVALTQGRNCYVKAVSGLDSIERRSEQVKNLGYLASAVTRTGVPLWYQGEDDTLPPQIEKRLHEYVDKSHAKMLAVIPLMKPQPNNEEGDQSQQDTKLVPVGALIIEQLKDSRIAPTLENRVNLVSQHAQAALTNSIDHNSIFLMPLWKAIGKVLNQFQGQKLFRTLAILTTVGLAGAFLCLFPYSFSLGSKGSLIPETQHEVYAQVDGILKEVLVSDAGDTIVEKDQVLARMTSSDLNIAIEDLKGRRKQAETELSICINREPDLTGSEARSNQLRMSQARQSVAMLGAELDSRLLDQQLLNVKAPSRGRVINWQVRQNLIRRPVRFGQHLMTIVDPDTQWLIELEMPERRLAHLAKAMQESKESGTPLEVTFGLLSHPGQEFEGTLDSVDQKLEVHSDEGNAALVRVTFANDTIPKDLLRAGTRVTAQIHCGTTSIGYAMFHELIETVDSKWKFWF